MKFEDRQATALITGGAVLFAIPAFLLGVMILVTGWIWAADTVGLIHLHAHALIWGWLSDQSHGVSCGKDCTKTEWTVSNYVLLVPLVVFTAYFIYQLCELTWASFRSFRREIYKPVR